MNAKLLVPFSLSALLAGGGALYTSHGTSLASYAQAQGAGATQAIQPLNENQAFLQDEQNTVQVFKTYGESVVAVNVEVEGRQMNPFAQGQLQSVPPEPRQFFQGFGQFGQPQQNGEQGNGQAERGAGSGFVVDKEGRLMTNYHVVEGALQQHSAKLKESATLTVSFSGSTDKLPVKVVGVNPSYDLALLELVDKNDLPKGVEPISIADSDALEVGQKVIAIGNPFGLESSVTTGIISAVGRDFTSVGQFNFPVIQTDAAINPGNSGGPLLDSKGNLVGINTAIVPNVGMDGQAGSLGIGFAIPSNQVTQNLAGLEKGGFADVFSSKPRMGVSVQDVSAYPEGVRASLGLPEQGEMVMAVEPGSPAARAGLHSAQFSVNVDGQELPAGGDVITAVDGQKISGSEDLQSLIFAKKVGDRVDLSVWRGGHEQTVTLKLAIVPRSS